jgi:hypothetical protein
MAIAGRWSNVSARTVLAAVTTRGAVNAPVVWLGGTEYDDLVTRVFLDYYRIQGGSPSLAERYPSRAQECAVLDESRHPEVLSARSVAEVQNRYACIPKTRLLPVMGLQAR